MKGLIPILDNGHGGIINGVYQTPGKRSPNWDFGVIYEGALNRWIVNQLITLLDTSFIPYYHVSPELRDITLQTRCNRANKIFWEHPNTYLLSVHFNGGEGTGLEGYTSPGQTKSDQICDLFLKDLSLNLPDEKPRFESYLDGDRDKEASYKILTSTYGPAILLELGFMDHRSDYEKLWDPSHREKLVWSLFGTIKALYQNNHKL